MSEGTWLGTALEHAQQMPGWKRALFALAAATFCGGLGMHGISRLSEEPTAEAAPWSSRSLPARTDDTGARASGAGGGGAADLVGDANPDAANVGWDSLVDDPDLAPTPLLSGSDLPATSDAVERSTGPTPGADVERVRPFGIPGPGAEEPELAPRTETEVETEPSGLVQWGPSLMVGGFSFFVAFCVGMALRIFARIAVVVMGLVFLILAGLAQVGFIQVQWDQMATCFDGVVGSFRAGAGGVPDVVRQALPSTAMSGLGLLAGLRKK